VKIFKSNVVNYKRQVTKMVKGYKIHAEMIREAVEELGSATPRAIMDFISTKYSEIEVKETSFRADIIGC